jgi:hypothetical protein
VQRDRISAADVTIRPMLPDDVSAARAAAAEALQDLHPEQQPTEEQERDQIASGHARAAHLLVRQRGKSTLSRMRDRVGSFIDNVSG